MLEEGASFAVLQYALYDKSSLIGLVSDGDQLRLLALTSGLSRGSS